MLTPKWLQIRLMTHVLELAYTNNVNGLQSIAPSLTLLVWH